MQENHASMTVDEEFLPLPQDKRTLGLPGNFAIWFACNMVTTTMLTGMMFIPALSFGTAMQALVLGCVLGIIPLVLIGVIGQKTGLVTMVAARATFGIRGAVLPSMINLVILIGWSWAQANLGGLALNHGIMTLTGWDAPTFWIIFCEVFVVLVALFAIKGIALYEKIAMVLIAAIMGAVIFKAFNTYGINNIFAIPAVPEDGLTAMIAFDIVVATALSWTVMGADYNRNCKTMRATVVGTGAGWALGTILSMGSGALMICMIIVGGHNLTYEPSLVFDEIGFGLAGSLVIFMSIVAANVMIIYSASMSVLNAFPKFNYTVTALVIGAICTAGAVFSGILGWFLDFVYIIGVLFMPIFAIMIADFFVVQKKHYNLTAITYPAQDSQYQYSGGVNWKAVGMFIVAALFAYIFGFKYPLAIGGTIPTFFLAFFGYIIIMKLTAKKS